MCPKTIRSVAGFVRQILGRRTVKGARSSGADLDGVLDLTMAKKVLVIDDDSDLLQLVSHCLKKKGYDVSCGLDGLEALSMAPQIMPDLIIIDVMLPSMNGDAVARIFKADEKLKHIPVILMSSEHEYLRNKSEASRADAYLNKPFDLAELSGMVTRYCEPSCQPAL